jgi:hypothetical protein
MNLSLKKKLSTIFVGLIAATALMGSIALAAETLDQSSTNQQNNIYFGAAGAGETFTAGQTGFLSKVSIPVQAFPQNCNYSYAKCGNLTVEIYSSTNVFASPSTLLATASIPFSAVSTNSLTWTDITFVNPPAITAGQQYLLHLPPSTASGISAFNAGFSTSNTYSGGNLMQSDSFPRIMYNYPTYDLAFKTFVTDSLPDTIAPTTTDNAPTKAVNQDVVVQLTAVDNANGSGVAVTYYTLDGGVQKTGTSVAIVDNGSHSLTYWSVDNSGNIERKQTKTIIIDKVAPTATVAYSTTDATNQDVTVTITPSEAVTGTTTHVFSANGTYTFEIVDAAGNTGSATATVNNIDKVAPVITIGTYTTTPTNQDVIVTATTNEGTLNAASHTFSENGSFSFTAVDAAGNTSTQTVTVSNIDKVAPITSDDATGVWANQDVTVNFSSYDSGLGVASTYYTINGGTQQNGNSVTLSAEGIYTLAYWSVDKAGNVEDQRTAAVKIDKTAPVMSFAGNLNAYTVDQNINISCSVDDALSGLLSTNCHDIVGPASGFTLGNNSYTFTATDNVGNVSTSTISFTLSVTPESLGNLTQQYFTDASDAASLTSKLNAIQESISKGNTKAKSGQIGAFINQIEAKIGKSITYQQAQILIQLAKKL